MGLPQNTLLSGSVLSYGSGTTTVATEQTARTAVTATSSRAMQARGETFASWVKGRASGASAPNPTTIRHAGRLHGFRKKRVVLHEAATSTGAAGGASGATRTGATGDSPGASRRASRLAPGPGAYAHRDPWLPDETCGDPTRPSARRRTASASRAAAPPSSLRRTRGAPALAVGNVDAPPPRGEPGRPAPGAARSPSGPRPHTVTGVLLDEATLAPSGDGAGAPRRGGPVTA
ncbi:hypothetical protein JL720_15936 [Aureococcus anophagefferens]|nr:hypothetical protein JL720_15936 [Aureococcus anophagefferens]